jgi:hypothetical protein
VASVGRVRVAVEIGAAVLLVGAGLGVFSCYERQIGARLALMERSRDSLDAALVQSREQGAQLTRLLSQQAIQVVHLQQQGARLAGQVQQVRDSARAAVVPTDSGQLRVARLYDRALALDSARIAALLQVTVTQDSEIVQLHHRTHDLEDQLGAAIHQRDSYRKEAHRFRLPIGGFAIGVAAGVVTSIVLRH